ncbi:hypothetical protein [Wenzhouxiangella marina]|nr:hypothetical protein [Wenzhouxiangella marina]MBB6088225.1 hypothetical protein [Wenzhouxiangella marina]
MAAMLANVRLACVFVVLVWCQPPASASNDPLGLFCPQCYDLNSARLLAENHAPPGPSGPGCGGLSPDGEDEDTHSGERASFGGCQTPIRRVFLINQTSGQVFSFRVWQEGGLPVAISEPLSSAESLVTDRIIELRVAWDELLQGMTIAGDRPLVASYSRPAGSIRTTGSCPEGTALDAVLDPAVMIQYEELIRLAAVQGLPPFNEGQSWVNNINGVGASAFGFGLSAQWEVGAQTYYEFTFERSEVPTPNIPDQLIFEVEYLGNAPASGTPLLNIQFNRDLSRAAGQPARNLERGGSYTNECVLAKIESALTDQGFTFHYPPHDPTPRPFPESGGGSGFNVGRCSKRLTARVNGEAQYSFIIFVDCVRP